jgi:hypothetical protein
MSKAKFLFGLAIMALVTFLIQAISGFVLWLVLERGEGNGSGKGLGRLGNEDTFIWARHTWIDIHDWTAVALLVIIAIHIFMHWRWLYNQLKSLLVKKLAKST